MATVNDAIAATDGNPLPGGWEPSVQQVLHWYLTQGITEPVERRHNVALCHNHHLHIAPRSNKMVRHCDKCLYFVRLAIDLGVKLVPLPPNICPSVQEELVRVQVEVLLDPNEYAITTEGGNKVAAAKSIVTGLLRGGEDIRHLKIHKAEAVYVPYASEAVIES